MSYSYISVNKFLQTTFFKQIIFFAGKFAHICIGFQKLLSLGSVLLGSSKIFSLNLHFSTKRLSALRDNITLLLTIDLGRCQKRDLCQVGGVQLLEQSRRPNRSKCKMATHCDSSINFFYKYMANNKRTKCMFKKMDIISGVKKRLGFKYLSCTGKKATQI